MSSEYINEQTTADDEKNDQEGKTKKRRRTDEEILEGKRQEYFKSLAKKKNKERKVEDRKKFLLGEYLMKLMQKTETNYEHFMNGLDGYLKRDEDRELFGLSPLENDKDIK